MAKNTKNYLDFVPVCNPEFEWTADRDGLVTVHVIHKGICAAVAQKVFHTPRISHIHLDRYGSYLWQQIDGKKDVDSWPMRCGTTLATQPNPSMTG